MSIYPDDLDVRPLTTWPGSLTDELARRRSPFSSTLGSTLTLLRTELSALGARHPVMEVAIAPESFRLDGRPRATARAEHPGVVLSLPSTAVGPLRYATDLFLTWQDNLRAIALGLEALRRVERYGITRRGEQYTGFRALPPATPTPGGVMDLAEACAVVARLGRVEEGHVRAADEAELTALYRRASRAAHPDAGGSTEAFQRLQAAMRVIRGEA